VAICTFFGHRDCPETIKPKLRETLIELIEHDGVDLFYVGNQGTFDAMVRSVLRELTLEYPQISYSVVLAYMPAKRNKYEDYSDTMLTEGVETVPRCFAISWRNKWMLRQSDYVVTYITHSWGGAAQFAELAERKGKIVVNIPNLE
jgi:uncharacterized phage-like protein YoqJ